MNTRHMPIASNRVRDIKAYYHSLLNDLYSPSEVSAFLSQLFEAFLGWDTVHLLLNANSTVNQSVLLKFYWASIQLQQYRPIQHIIGYTFFLDCKINVTPNTLIPRPETEEIVSRVVAAHNTPPCSVLDICTGSGCIAIALARAFTKASVHAVDISDAALQVARSNALQNNVEVLFSQADILQPSFSLPSAAYNLIVSNPPYICQSEQANMSPNVLNYEPHQALFVSDSDPLLFYRVIAKHATKALAPNGLLVFEVSQYHAHATQALLQAMGYNTALYSDFKGALRMLVASIGSPLPSL